MGTGQDSGRPPKGNSTPGSMGAGKIIAACSIGNFLEWYDIVLYSYVAVYISKVFFPTGSETASLLLTFGTFFVGYLIRPIGALILGAYADKAGRKPALVLTLYMMALGTVLLAVIPPYSMIGIAAPVLVLLARFLQGFSAGGEFGSATTMMIEHLPVRKGFAASFQFTSQGASTVLAASAGLVLTSTLTAHQIETWGFRAAFLVGGLVFLVAVYLRRNLPESPEFMETGRVAAADNGAASGKRPSIWKPAGDLLRSHLPAVLLMIGIGGLGSAVTYLMSYIPTYSINSLGLPSYVGFAAVLVTAILQMILYPISGATSDRFGKPQQMILGAILIAVFIYPIFGVLGAVASAAVLFPLLAFLEVFKAWFSAPSGALQGIIFPAETRGLGLAFSYNCGVAIFGGLTPFMSEFLIDATGQKGAPSYWLMMTAVIAIGCLWVVIRKYRIDAGQGKAVKPSSGEGSDGSMGLEDA